MNNPQNTYVDEFGQNPDRLSISSQPATADPATSYTFSADELRVLKECNVESFFQRSLPFGIGFGVAAYFGVKHGYLKPNLSYGPVPKVVAGVVVGYFLGKFSYQQKCIEKIMRLPNSRLADLLRQRQSGGMGTLLPDQNFGLSPFTPNVPDIYSDEHARSSRSSSFNLDTNRPSQPGLDDTYRPSLDDPTLPHDSDVQVAPVKPGTTYEDLRKRNREEYVKRHQSAYSRPLPPDGPPVRRSNEKPIVEIDDFDGQTAARERRNKYGDTWNN